MPPALITDCGVATIGAGPVLTAVTAGTGSTFTVRNAALQSGVWLTDAWRASAHLGTIQISSPNLVPVSNGISLRVPTGLASFSLYGPPYQSLIPQDALTVSSNGTAADVDLVAIQSYYENLPGGGMTLKSPGDIYGQCEFEFAWPITATSSATAGAQNSTVITTTVDSSTANTWYAVVGYTVDTTIGCIGISGVDTSQFFCGGPGDTAAYRTCRYFADLSENLGKPAIPCWNSANKGNTNLVLADRAASTTVHASLILAQMPGGWTP